MAGRAAGLPQPAALVDLGVGLRNHMIVLFVGRQVADLPRDAAVPHLAIRGLDESQIIAPGIGGQRADQTDVRTLWGLDGAHPAVVAGVHVADLKAGAFAAQSAGAQRRQPAFVRQLGQRFRLIHELRQLTAAEELFDRGHDRTNVDQYLRRDLPGLLNGHPLTDDTLHPQHADAELILQQLPHRPHPAVAQVVDVVDGDAFLFVVQTDQVPHHFGDIVSYGRGMAHALPGYDVQRFPGRRGDPQHHTRAGLQLFDIDGLAIDTYGHAGQLPGELAAIFQGQRKLLLVAPDGDILDLAACRLHQRSECQWRLEPEFAVQLVPPYLTQVVPPRIEEERLH